MTHTISGTYSTLVTLGSGTDNPTTITSSGLVNDGLQISFAGLVLLNAGSIAQGTALNGVVLFAPGSVTNQSGGSIAGGRGISAGIFGVNGAVTVVNAGYIANYVGINLLDGGSVTNQTGGDIVGHGPRAVGVVGRAGGISITNQSGGYIGSSYQGISGGSMTVVNAGTIAGGSASGIRLGGGSVTNQSGGTIKDASANAPAIGGYGALTVTNAGTIDGGTVNAVQLAAGVTNRLVVDPGAVFVGGVDGGNTIGAASVSTMELAGRSAGTLSGVGTQFVDFVQTTVDTGASWTLTGGITLAAGTTLTDAGTLTVTDTTINDGSIRIDPSTATFGTLIGTGTVAISGGSTLDVLGSVAAGETIDFGAGSNLLGINPTEFAAQIDGFVAGDTIELTGVTDGISAAIVNGNTLQIERTAHPAVELKLDPTVNYTGNNYAVGSDGAVTEAAPCFLRGTLVRTERGEVAVQDLAIGERVLTLSGQIRPIMWIGTGHVVVCRGHRSAATPVIVRKSAFTDQVPDRDLRVTKGHSFYFDGVLVPIEYLVNHRSILWDDRAQEVELYHLELESHDVLLANGAPAESYRDDGNRWLFQNGTGALPQHNQEPCAPVLTGGPVVDALWRRLLKRAGPPGSLPLTDDADVHLVVNGKRLDAFEQREDALVFRLSARPRTVRIGSRAAVPQELGLARDQRSLGVAIRRIVLAQARRLNAIEADAVSLSDGYHAFEAQTGIRWTNGDAAVPAALFAGMSGPGLLMLQFGAMTRYPDAGVVYRAA